MTVTDEFRAAEAELYNRPANAQIHVPHRKTVGKLTSQAAAMAGRGQFGGAIHPHLWLLLSGI
jgi:hypothetical protein